jgi:hypothetical protein
MRGSDPTGWPKLPGAPGQASNNYSTYSVYRTVQSRTGPGAGQGRAGRAGAGRNMDQGRSPALLVSEPQMA